MKIISVPLKNRIIYSANLVCKILYKIIIELISRPELDWQPRSLHEYVRLPIQIYKPFNNMEVFTLLPYRDPKVQELILNLKFKNNQKAARIAGYLLLLGIQKIISRETKSNRPQPSEASHENIFINIIPALASNKRRKEKGFDQCLEITKKLKCLDLNLLLNTSCGIVFALQRKNQKQTTRQLTLGRKDRFANVSDSFRIKSDCYREITFNTLNIIFDDVTTTGATLNEAVTSLQNFLANKRAADYTHRIQPHSHESKSDMEAKIFGFAIAH